MDVSWRLSHWVRHAPPVLHKWTIFDQSAGPSSTDCKENKHHDWPGVIAPTFAEDVQKKVDILSNMRWLPLNGILVAVLLASDDQPVPGDGPVHVHDIARDMLHDGWA